MSCRLSRTAAAVAVANSLIVTLVTLSTQVAHAAAQDEAAVVVTATRFASTDPRVPANITVVTRDDIRNSPALDLPDVIKNVAGVDVRPLYGNMGTDATVDLRGFGDTATSNTLILLDGQRLNPIDMGSIAWSAIPLESIRRIEIIRGAGTVLYGDRASGGVINIITDKSAKPRASLAATVGSFGYRSADASGATGSDKGYAKVFAHYATADGWRQNSQQDQQAVSGRAGLYLGDSEAFVDYAAYKESAGLPGYLLPAAYQADPRATTTPQNNQYRDGYRLRPGVRLQLADQLSLEAEATGENALQRWHTVSAFGISDSNRNNRSESFTPRLRWNHGLGTLASETVLGFDYYDGRFDSRSTSAPVSWAAQTSTAFYFQNSTSLSETWTVTVGGRNQRMKQSVHQDAYAAWFTPAMDGGSTRSQDAYDLGVSYATAAWRVYGKTGSTFRFANTDELFGYDFFTFNPVFAGDLRPQHGTIEEIGGSLTAGSVQGRASLYQLDLTDEIGYDSSVGPMGANINFAPTRRQGLETEIDWRLGSSVRAQLSYTHLEAEFRSGPYAGKRIPLVARDKAALQLTWAAGAAGTYSATVNAVGSRPYSGDFANLHDQLGGYATLDLQGSWNLKPWTLSAKLLNAFDKRYAAVAGYATYLTPPNYYYYPADGRSFYVSARYDLK